MDGIGNDIYDKWFLNLGQSAFGQSWWLRWRSTWAAIPSENCLRTFPHTNVIIWAETKMLSSGKLKRTQQQKFGIHYVSKEVGGYKTLCLTNKSLYYLRPQEAFLCLYDTGVVNCDSMLVLSVKYLPTICQMMNIMQFIICEGGKRGTFQVFSPE